MSQQTLTQHIDDPCEQETNPDFKILGKLRELLETSTRRDAAVEHAPETIDKTVLGFPGAAALCDGVCEILLSVLEMIREAPDVHAALGGIIALLKPQERGNVLSVHRTTADATIPHMTREEMERVVEDDYVESMEELATERARSPAVTLSIDITYKKSRPAHLNGCYSYVIEGQHVKWDRGLKFSAVYDCTNQHFLGNIHRDNYTLPGLQGGLRPWIHQLQ